MPGHAPRTLGLGLIGALGIALAACSSGAGTSAPAPTPATTAVSVPSTASPAAASSTPSAAASPSIAALIPDGTYVSTPIQVADAINAINADTKLTTAEKTDLIDNGFEIRGHTSFVVSLRFASGSIDQGKSVDGGADQIGSHATFAFPDDHTLVIQEQGSGLTTFTVTWTGASFSLSNVMRSGSEVDALAARILFASAPFTLKP